MDQLLTGSVSALHSVDSSSISSGKITVYLIRSKQLSSGTLYRTQCLLDFLVMVIQFIIVLTRGFSRESK